VSRLCRPASIGLALIAPSRGVESPVPTGVHTLVWTAAGWMSWKPPAKKIIGCVWCGRTQFQWTCWGTEMGGVSDVRRGVCMRESKEWLRRFFICLVFIYLFFDFCFWFFVFNLIYFSFNCAREIMSCYIRNFPGGRHNQGWRGGLIWTKCGEVSWGGWMGGCLG